MANKLLCLDLFSGIGGMSLALHDFVKTIQYCELDPFCQCVLNERMKEGSLDKACIHGNIRTLHMSEAIKPDIIVGGFPCQDISCIGLQKGINEGERSGLFYEIMRILDECPSVSYVFLENVANIINCGLDDVIRELTKRNFNLQWLVKSAESLGAPHVRNRWFCLACRNDAELPNIPLPDAHHAMFDWSCEPFERITFKPHVKQDDSFDDNWIQRCQTLGNTVVPDVVRSSFIDLVKLQKNSSQLWECLGQHSTSIESLKNAYPECAVVIRRNCLELPKTRTVISHGLDIKLEMNGRSIEFQKYPTPRRGITHASSLTERSLRDLPTILVYCNKTKEYIKTHISNINENELHLYLLPNVNYIEWMMGFPKDWTKANSYVKAKSYRANVQSVGSLAAPASELDVEVEDTSVAMTNDEHDNNTPTPTIETPSVAIKKPKYNGMHMLMREHKGKDIVAVSALWKQLSVEERKIYSERAKQL